MQSTTLQKLCYEAMIETHVYESVATVSYYAQFTTQGIDMGGGFTWTGEGVHMDRRGRCSQQPYRSCVMRPW